MGALGISKRLAILAVTSACWGSLALADHHPARTKELYEAARKEGLVVGYYGTLRTATEGPNGLISIFEKRFPGIKVRLVYGSGAQSREKILAEAGAGRRIGDIMSGGENTIMDIFQEGVIAVYRSPEVREDAVLVNPILSSPKEATPFRALAYGITYNTELVPKERIPYSWKDLLHPFWKDKLSMQDPGRGTGGGFSLFGALWEKPGFGKEYWMALAKQNVFRQKGSGPLLQLVARGEHAATLTDHSGNYWELKKGAAPVAFIKPKEGIHLSLIPMAVIKSAPHPNAAKLWVDWSISEEAQRIIAGAGYTPVRKGIKTSFPEASMEGVNVLQNPTATNVELWLERVRSVFGN
ncbi:MAG: extracellular solute-binding protein [Deltaproteobacteria bacterium]|nr:extracellular solute-binding protein [Deltaproteobacteria bacterium]